MVMNVSLSAGWVAGLCWLTLSRVLAHSLESTHLVTFSHTARARTDGDTYKTVDSDIYDWPKTPAIGYIPQVEHTYGYIDGQYGIINEHQLAIGESTCGGKLVAVPVHAGGDALLDVTQLSKIAMERCKTARCAVQTMGDLATEYGYYGAAWSGDMSNQLGEAGEALTVADPEEAWVFHIHPDQSGKSAVWVAQRVPDNHVAAVANQFIIRQVDLKDKDNFLGSDNIFSTAQKAGFWKPEDGEFDFTIAYSLSRGNHSSYANRRVWRVFTLSNEDLDLSPYTPAFSTYPFSVPVKDPLTVDQVLAMNRDHYEGTKFDTTLGVAAGPYGNPNRFDGGASYNGDLTGAESGWGVFERPISMFRTTYSFVTQSRSHLPDTVGAMLWFSVHAPHGAVYMPLYASSDVIPRTLTVGNRYKFDEESQFWVDMTVANYMETRYLPMIGDVRGRQLQMEARAAHMQERVEEKVVEKLKQADHSSKALKEAKETLESFTHHNADTVREEWWDFFKFLVTKFHDGYRIDDFHAEYVPEA